MTNQKVRSAASGLEAAKSVTDYRVQMSSVRGSTPGAEGQIPSLFDEPINGAEQQQERVALPLRIGRVQVEEVAASSILTKASGFMAEYDYTLNPYAGCAYGCTYCYAAFFSRSVVDQESWGTWVRAKTNALDRLRRSRTDLSDKTVYMSSVTDPYQPIERRLGLVRELLPVLAERGVRLVVQTRSPLVTRDIDLFAKFRAVRVNMTVTTDDRAVERAFEPHCASNNRRLAAISRVAAAGINASITMTPLLPLRDPEGFADRLASTGVQSFVVQPFHADRGRFIAGTRAEALRLTEERGWDQAAYRRAVDVLARRLPSLAEGREGFAPE